MDFLIHTAGIDDKLEIGGHIFFSVVGTDSKTAVTPQAADREMTLPSHGLVQPFDTGLTCRKMRLHINHGRVIEIPSIRRNALVHLK
jgi:hypothetical protein